MSAPRLRAHEFEEAAADRILDEGMDPLTFRAMFGIFRLASRMFNDLESTIHRPAGWSLAGFRVMFLLWVNGPMESHQIARLSGLTRPAISSAVNTLERDGLVARQRESVDGRVVTVHISDDGSTRLRQTYQRQNERERLLLAAVNAQELDTLTDLMRRLSDGPLPDPPAGVV